MGGSRLLELYMAHRTIHIWRLVDVLFLGREFMVVASLTQRSGMFRKERVSVTHFRNIPERWVRLATTINSGMFRKERVSVTHFLRVLL